MAENGFYRFLTTILALGLVMRRLTNRVPATAPLQRGNAQPPVSSGSERDSARQTSELLPGLRGKYQLVVKAVNNFMDDDCTTMAAALAYYTTFSMRRYY